MEILAREILHTYPKPHGVTHSCDGQKIHALIVDELKSSGYFSLSVDSTSDLHISIRCCT